MKRYFDLNEGLKKSETYDPIARRGGVEPDFSFVDKLKPAGSKKEKEKESDVLPRISKKVRKNKIIS